MNHATLDPVLEQMGFTSPLITPDLVIPPDLAPLKLGVLASGSGSNFEAIAQAIQQGQLAATIQVMIHNKPKIGAVDRANRFGIPTQYINHRSFDSRELFDQAVADALKAHNVEWVIMAGWMRRVTHVLLKEFPKSLNIHPSLLPSFPGVHAIEQALDHQVKVTGCTVHWVELEVDSGPIIIQAAVPVLPTDTPDTLHRRIQVQEHRIYPAAIALAAQAVASQA